jgi:hypothetical protein
VNRTPYSFHVAATSSTRRGIRGPACHRQSIFLAAELFRLSGSPQTRRRGFRRRHARGAYGSKKPGKIRTQIYSRRLACRRTASSAATPLTYSRLHLKCNATRKWQNRYRGRTKVLDCGGLSYTMMVCSQMFARVTDRQLKGRATGRLLKMLQGDTAGRSFVRNVAVVVHDVNWSCVRAGCAGMRGADQGSRAR